MASERRVRRLAAVVLLLSASLLACKETPQTELVLLGHPDAVQRATLLIPDITARRNTPPDEGAAVVFVISATDGPMPQTREQIENLRGKQYRRSAILLVNTQNLDPELIELVTLETRELLQRYEQPAAATMPIFRDDGANVGLQLRALIGPL
jgi:hypothetical protein